MTGNAFTDGYWYYFEDEGAQIAAAVSLWSGGEKAFFNNQLVHKSWSIMKFFKVPVRRVFETENGLYELRLRLTNMWTSEIECTLERDGKLIGCQSLSLSDVKYGRWLVAACFFAGILVGATLSRLMH